MRTFYVAGAILLSQLAGPVFANELDQPSESLYAGAAGVFEIPDGGRHAQNGYGIQLTGGMPLLSHPGYAFEISYSLLTRKRDSDGSNDNQNTVMLNLARDFNTYQFSNGWTPKFRPFALAGIGAVEDDVAGQQRINPGLNVGGGLKFPLGYFGATLRTQLTVTGEYNTSKTEGLDQSFYADFHLSAGLDFPLGVALQHAAAPAQPAVDPSCETPGIDPVSGRRACLIDSDHDGVTDSSDRCPETPAGVAVGRDGCPLTKR